MHKCGAALVATAAQDSFALAAAQRGVRAMSSASYEKAPRASKGAPAADGHHHHHQKQQQQQQQLYYVLPSGPSTTDNLLLCCGDGNVLTNADMLHMLSPPVLGDAVDMARLSPMSLAGSGLNTTLKAITKARSSSSAAAIARPSIQLLQLPVPEDVVEDWLLVLRLVHPGMRPQERPYLDWVSGLERGGGLWRDDGGRLWWQDFKWLSM